MSGTEHLEAAVLLTTASARVWIVGLLFIGALACLTAQALWDSLKKRMQAQASVGHPPPQRPSLYPAQQQQQHYAHQQGGYDQQQQWQ